MITINLIPNYYGWHEGPPVHIVDQEAIGIGIVMTEEQLSEWRNNNDIERIYVEK